MSAIDSIFNGEPFFSEKYGSLEELLTQLKDNTTNSIQAQDIRDAVYTLWDRVDEVEAIAISAASQSTTYTNTNPVPQTIGGIQQGETFNEATLSDMFDKLLYPYIAPSPSITGGQILEYGDSISPRTLSWSVTTTSELLNSILFSATFAGTTISPSSVIPNTSLGVQSGTVNVGLTHSTSSVPVSTINQFIMTINDDEGTYTNNSSYTWRNKRYWGKIDLSSIGNPNLTTNPSSITAVQSLVNSGIVNGLSGAGVGSGNELTTSKNKVYNGMNGAGDYLIFAWPSNVSNSQSPNFSVNGLPSSAFTRVHNNWTFTNSFGFQTNYEVWISNTLQNSPLNIEIN